jgi:ribosome biogenesis GTPase A
MMILYGMANFWDLIHRVLNEADMLLIVLDARMISQTRNMEIEKKVIKTGKPYIYVISKSDLIDPVTQYTHIVPHSVFLSAKKHQGTSILREKIQIYAARAGLKNTVKIGVLGYPNVGKSSLINALSGRHVASVSSISGHTRGLKNIRMSSKLILLDTPGVIPYQEKNEMKHIMTGTIDYGKQKDPDVAAVFLMNEFPSIIEHYYKVPKAKDKYKTLEAIAKKRKLIAKGGIPDVLRAGTMILKDWQTGKIVNRQQ